MKRITMAIALALASIQQAAASSDGAWAALFAKANGTCIGQSGLDSPEATVPVVFDDATGKAAILLRGSMGDKRGALRASTSSASTTRDWPSFHRRVSLDGSVAFPAGTCGQGDKA